jgi:hypothetical protein
VAVRGSELISFPVFWEYSFKAVSKTPWNGKEDVPRLELPVEDMIFGRKMAVLDGG